jgi:hypothetical protein
LPANCQKQLATVLHNTQPLREIMTSESDVTNDGDAETQAPAEAPVIKTRKKAESPEKPKPPENKVVRLLEKNPLGMTLPEMSGGPRQLKKIKLLRPLLAEAIRDGLVMPVSQRAGNTVYRLVKYLGPR